MSRCPGPCRSFALAALLAACAGFAGCTGSLFQSRAVPASAYLLSARLGADSRDSPVSTQSIPVDLAVEQPRVRTGLDGDRIALLYADRRIDYLADARWSGSLDQVIQDLAVEAFATGAHLRNVSADASAFPSGYWLEIDVTDFQAEYAAANSAPIVHVHLLARLGAAADRRVIASFDAGAREAASENRLTAIIAAYEKAVDAALAQIVRGTSASLQAASEHR